MSRRFKVIHKKDCIENAWGEKECPTVEITVHNPPYEDENIVKHIGTKWTVDQVDIIDITQVED